MTVSKHKNIFNIENISAAAVSLVMAVLFGIASPLHPFINGEAGTDSSVFKTVALMMDRGFMPYRDSFDHKGPFLYILNFLGNRISQYRGIWVIEVLFIAVTLFMLYKTARLFCGRIPAVTAALVSFSLMFNYFSGGNLSEEYALTPIVISTFIFLDYFKNRKINAFRLIICGFGFGMVLLLRPNMAGLWAVFTIAVLIDALVNKKAKDLLRFILWFVIGTLIAVLPVVIWFVAKGSLNAFIDDYIIFNMKYISTASPEEMAVQRKNVFLYFLNTPQYILAVIITAAFIIFKPSLLNIFYGIYVFLSLVLVSMSGEAYGHYGMVLVAVIIYPLSLVFEGIEKTEEKTVRSILKYGAVIYLLFVLVIPGWKSLIQRVPQVYEGRNDDHVAPVVREICDIIDENTLEYEPVSVYGNWNIIYLLAKRPHATLYSYQYPIGEVNPRILDDYFAQLNKDLPKYIVVQEKRYDEAMARFLEGRYSLVWSTNYYDMYQGIHLFERY